MSPGSSIPIPHRPEHTEYLKAGAVTIGVEFRDLKDEVGLFYKLNPDRQQPPQAERPKESGHDHGVSIHVFGSHGDELVEYLRFDCFAQRPHYHYFTPRQEAHGWVTIDPGGRFHLDTAAEGEALPWAIERLRNRLPSMLAKTGALELSQKVEQQEIEAVLPKVAMAAEAAMQQHASSSKQA